MGVVQPRELSGAADGIALDDLGEPKESILSRLSVTAISHYFSEFERELPRYLERSGHLGLRGRRLMRPTQPTRSTVIIRCRPVDSLGPRSRPILQRTLSPAPNSSVTSLKSR
jgi:hypothetical protein